MTKQFIRDRLRAAVQGSTIGHIEGDEGRAQFGDRRRTPAAVLIGLVDRADGPSVLLTQRTLHLKAHSGQISFPGGRVEPEDLSATAAALREAHEEIGLESNFVDVLGSLRPYETVTGFTVYPIVGWVAARARYQIDPFEVAELFEMPLAFALDPTNRRRESGVRGGIKRSYWVFPFENRRIWGATAAMLVNFASVLNQAS